MTTTILLRDGMNIIHDCCIFADGALGTSIEVPTLDGRLKKNSNATQVSR